MAYSVTNPTTLTQNEVVGGSGATFTFTLSRAAADPDATYQVVYGDPADPTHYLTPNTDDFTNGGHGNITFAGSATTADFTITAAIDTTVEPTERFLVLIYPQGSSTFTAATAAFYLTDDTPVFSSLNPVDSAENQTAVETVTASGSGTTFSTTLGGPDAGLFSITSGGVLTWRSAADYEAGGHAHDYHVTVTATESNGQSATQDLVINLTNVNEAPVITDNAGADSATASVTENTTAVGTFHATDPDAGDTVQWSVTGADASLFHVDANTGALSFVNAPNFEHPTASGGGNTYHVNVVATDGGQLTDTQALAITVTNDTNEPPVITSNGGGDIVLLHLPENTATTTAVANVTAVQDDNAGITYATGGTDGGLFDIDASGKLTFHASPDFEAPADSNHDNLYDFTVIATAAGHSDTQHFYVFVDNVAEATDPGGDNGLGGIGGGTGGGGGGTGGGTGGGAGGGTGGGTGGTPTDGDDILFGTNVTDLIGGGAGNDTIDGGGGDDTLDGNDGNDYVIGDTGNDFIRGLNGDDTISGGDGNDTVNGNLGNDSVVGDSGDDMVMGGQGNDTVDGGDGNDTVNGNIGDDTVLGGLGSDMVYGGQGNDTINGGQGDDTLSGDLGDDVLIGGFGADKYMFGPGKGHDWVVDFNGLEGDRIVLPTGTHFTMLNVQNQVVLQLDDGSTIGLVGFSPANFDASWIVSQ